MTSKEEKQPAIKSVGKKLFAAICFSSRRSSSGSVSKFSFTSTDSTEPNSDDENGTKGIIHTPSPSGCMKGSRMLRTKQKSTSTESSEPTTDDDRLLDNNDKTDRRVSFNIAGKKSINVHEFEPLFEYHNDLWWTPDEIDVFQSVTSENPYRSRDIVAYLEAVREGQKIVSKKKSSSRKNVPAKQILPEKIFKRLLVGRCDGLAGLETLYLSSRRSEQIRDIISAIATNYNIERNNLKQENKKNTRSRNSNNKITDIDVITKKVGLQAASLSAEHRDWAVIIAQFDTEAVYGDGK